MKKLILNLFSILLISGGLFAQENLTYQKPPQEILELIDVPLAPSTLIDSDAKRIVFIYRDQFKSIAELSEEELRLGGLRINPITNISSRATYYKNIEVKDMSAKNPTQIKGLPQDARLANFSWSPDESKMAFTHTTSEGVELWVADLNTATAKKLTEARLNANMRDVINWSKDNKSILVKMLPGDRKKLIDPQSAVPTGPTVSVSDEVGGKRS